VMRAFLATTRPRYTPEQLDLLVPAFDLAWSAEYRTGRYMPGGADEQAAKDRLARIVVDLVTRGQMRTVGEIASAATIVLRDQGRSPAPAADQR
jgi:hypothetical protein